MLAVLLVEHAIPFPPMTVTLAALLLTLIILVPLSRSRLVIVAGLLSIRSILSLVDLSMPTETCGLAFGGNEAVVRSKW